MKRIATIGAIAAVTAAGLSVAPAQAATTQLATKAVTTKSDPHFSPAERAAAIREAKADATSTARALRLPSAERLRPSDALADTNGAMHIRYNRTYQGLR